MQIPKSLVQLQARYFQQPHETLADPGMSLDEKRALLAPGHLTSGRFRGTPTLRQLEDGSHVEVHQILQALKALDEGHDIQFSLKRWLRPLERRRPPASRFSSRMRHRRSRSDDDDDPPPCPAYAAIPPKQGAGGAVACPESGQPKAPSRNLSAGFLR
jgi:hypothetical protein